MWRRSPAAVAGESGVPADVAGHSYGGRCALGAGLRTDAIRRIVSYEGAPTPAGASYHPTGVEGRLRERLAAGDADGALATFLREVVGMSERGPRGVPGGPGLAAPGRRGRRRSCASSRPRRIPAASLATLGRVRQPVLQLLGGESLPVFRDATMALDERLADGRVVVIDGARHAAHHTHPAVVVEAIRDFLA